MYNRKVSPAFIGIVDIMKELNKTTKGFQL